MGKPNKQNYQQSKIPSSAVKRTINDLNDSNVKFSTPKKQGVVGAGVGMAGVADLVVEPGVAGGLSEDGKLDRIMKKLEKLDILDTLKQDVGELKLSLEFCHSSVEELQRDNGVLHGRVKGLEQQLDSLNTELVSIKRQRTVDNDKQLENQWRSMRDNLMFYGLAEKPDENAENILSEFLTKELGLDTATISKIDFARVHRVGQIKEGKCRPIVAKFERYKDRETVRSRASRLAGKKFGISEQLPHEWSERRKQLLPKLKQAKAEKKKAKFVKDMLIIDGKAYSCAGPVENKE